jgi:hypothetical protein
LSGFERFPVALNFADGRVIHALNVAEPNAPSGTVLQLNESYGEAETQGRQKPGFLHAAFHTHPRG